MTYLIRLEQANTSWLFQISKVFCLLNMRWCLKCAEQVVDTAESSLFLLFSYKKNCDSENNCIFFMSLGKIEFIFGKSLL